MSQIVLSLDNLTYSILQLLKWSNRRFYITLLYKTCKWSIPQIYSPGLIKLVELRSVSLSVNTKKNVLDFFIWNKVIHIKDSNQTYLIQLWAFSKTYIDISSATETIYVQTMTTRLVRARSQHVHVFITRRVSRTAILSFWAHLEYLYYRRPDWFTWPFLMSDKCPHLSPLFMERAISIFLFLPINFFRHMIDRMVVIRNLRAAITLFNIFTRQFY